ncbi:MAG TPA: hypothetical protein VMF91_03990 [Bryobacteraceae bacterium]|nr:hypothetical protein [Bryobacteraceae bacterium]
MESGTRGGITARGVLFGPGKSPLRRKRYAAGRHIPACFAMLSGGCLFRLFFAVLFATTPLLEAATASHQTEFKVSTPEFAMEVDIQFYDGVRQAPRFYTNSEGKGPICLSVEGRPCGKTETENWIGSYAIVHFKLLRQAAGSNASKLRERVRVIDQDADLPDRPPFESAIPIGDRTASDIELYGYSEDSAGKEAQDGDRTWRFLRQELFYGSQERPFLILHWKHTVESIRLIDAIPVGSARLQTH